MQTYLNQRKVLFKKIKDMIQDPTVNHHEHTVYDFPYHQQAN